MTKKRRKKERRKESIFCRVRVVFTYHLRMFSSSVAQKRFLPFLRLPSLHERAFVVNSDFSSPPSVLLAARRYRRSTLLSLLHQSVPLFPISASFSTTTTSRVRHRTGVRAKPWRWVRNGRCTETVHMRRCSRRCHRLDMPSREDVVQFCGMVRICICVWTSTCLHDWDYDVLFQNNIHWLKTITSNL